MLIIQLSHFSAALTFALFTSIVFGITQRNTRHEMARYGLKVFTWLVVGLVGGGWFMWLLRH